MHWNSTWALLSSSPGSCLSSWTFLVLWRENNNTEWQFIWQLTTPACADKNLAMSQTRNMESFASMCTAGRFHVKSLRKNGQRFFGVFGHHIKILGWFRYLEQNLTRLDKKLSFYGHFKIFLNNTTFSNVNVEWYSLGSFFN